MPRAKTASGVKRAHVRRTIKSHWATRAHYRCSQRFLFEGLVSRGQSALCCTATLQRKVQVDATSLFRSCHGSLLQRVALCSPATNFEGYSETQKAWWSKSCSAPWYVSARTCWSSASLGDVVLAACSERSCLQSQGSLSVSSILDGLSEELAKDGEPHWLDDLTCSCARLGDRITPCSQRQLWRRLWLMR